MSIQNGQPVAAAASNAAWLGQEFLRSGASTTTASASTLTLTSTSSAFQIITGSTTQKIVLPDATTLVVGRAFKVSNRSTGSASIYANDGTTLLLTLTAGNQSWIVCRSISSSNGTFDVDSIPVVFIGDSGSGGAIGLVPAPAAGDAAAGKVLGADGLWDVPSGGGSSVTGSYYQGFFASAVSWGTSSATYVDPTNSGGNTLTSRVSSGITITAAASNVAGITFSPSVSTAVYLVTFTMGLSGGPSQTLGQIKITDGTNTISELPLFQLQPGVLVSQSMTGIYVPGTTSAVTLKIQIAAASGPGPVTIEAGALTSPPMEVTVVRIK